MSTPELSIGFDAYAATVETDPDALVAHLASKTSSTPELAKSKGRWTELWNLHRGDSVVATVGYTATRPDEPFVECKRFAPEIVPLIRERYRHRVARVDARMDFSDPDFWYVLEPILLDFARSRGLYHEPMGPHTQPELGGRTWYLGNRQSKSMRLVRLYEKGCELGLPTRGPIRLEHQVRPPSKLKAHFATLTAEQVLLDSPFVRHVCEKLNLDLGAARRADVDRERSNLDRVLDAFARQYLPTLRLCMERYSSLAELVEDLEHRLDLDAEVRAALKQTRRTEAWPT